MFQLITSPGPAQLDPMLLAEGATAPPPSAAMKPCVKHASTTARLGLGERAEGPARSSSQGEPHRRCSRTSGCSAGALTWSCCSWRLGCASLWPKLLSPGQRSQVLYLYPALC